MLAECKLYIIAGHPTCAVAEHMLLEWVEQSGLLVELVDLAEHPALRARLGNDAPVLERLDSGARMAWPFDLEDIEHFLK